MTAQALVDSCGPSFLQIYDFQVGDVFQDSQATKVSGSGTWIYHRDRKYRVTSREALPHGFRCHLEGLMKSSRFDVDEPRVPDSNSARFSAD